MNAATKQTAMTSAASVASDVEYLVGFHVGFKVWDVYQVVWNEIDNTIEWDTKKMIYDMMITTIDRPLASVCDAVLNQIRERKRVQSATANRWPQ
jgi:hypothetical protein